MSKASRMEPYDSIQDQKSAALMGMWVFLVTELLFFGALIAAFLLYRFMYAPAFSQAARHLSVSLGTLNTAVLLTSSFSMALSLKAAEKGQTRWLVAGLVFSIFLAFAFLGIKGVEYSHEYHEHLFPNGDFRFTPLYFENARLFFYLYFVMTAFHALHIAIGIIAISFVAVRALRGAYSVESHAGVEVVALYWHFVDIVWVFLFPLLYLLDHSR